MTAGSRAGGSGTAIATVVVVMVAANLRPAVTSVSPLVRGLSHSVHLSNLQISALSALPVVCFGALAPLAIVVANRWGVARALFGAMLLLTVGLVARVSAGAWLLLGGTVVATGGIAIANIVVPAYVKQECGVRAGAVIGTYSATMSAAAALAAAASPALVAGGAGWRVALGIWALPSGVAAAFIAVTVAARAGSPSGYHQAWEATKPVGVWGRRGFRRERNSMEIIIMTSAQAVVYYSLLAWLPSILEARGLSSESAGTMLSVFAIGGVPMSLALPVIAVRLRRQWPLVVIVTCLTCAGLLGLIAAPTSVPLIWTLLLGLGQGGIYALVLTFFIIKTENPLGAARLSLVAQMTSFLVGACGSFALGLLSRGEQDWDLPLILLVLVLVPQVLAGAKAGLAPAARIE
jgi:CP family cyanate transporter-like MFS transporter